MNTLLSLFDYSCHWSGEYYDAGWDVYNIELKFKDHPFCFPCADIMDLDSCEQLLELDVFPDGRLHKYVWKSRIRETKVFQSM